MSSGVLLWVNNSQYSNSSLKPSSRDCYSTSKVEQDAKRVTFTVPNVWAQDFEQMYSSKPACTSWFQQTYLSSKRHVANSCSTPLTPYLRNGGHFSTNLLRKPEKWHLNSAPRSPIAATNTFRLFLPSPICALLICLWYCMLACFVQFLQTAQSHLS